jgi:hypothetical protein
MNPIKKPKVTIEIIDNIPSSIKKLKTLYIEVLLILPLSVLLWLYFEWIIRF